MPFLLRKESQSIWKDKRLFSFSLERLTEVFEPLCSKCFSHKPTGRNLGFSGVLSDIVWAMAAEDKELSPLVWGYSSDQV